MVGLCSVSGRQQTGSSTRTMAARLYHQDCFAGIAQVNDTEREYETNAASGRQLFLALIYHSAHVRATPDCNLSPERGDVRHTVLLPVMNK